MPKGENLEKPKKGGMVLIIGMGAKPKKDKEKMKKQERRRPPRRGGRNSLKRARRHAFKQQMRKNPTHFEDTLKKLKIPRQLFSMFLNDVKNMSIDEMLADDSQNIPALIDEVKKINNANRGHFKEDGSMKDGIKNLLERRRINPNEFKRSLNKNPFQDFQERINQLAGESARGRKGNRPPRKGQPRRGSSKGPMFEGPGVSADAAYAAAAQDKARNVPKVSESEPSGPLYDRVFDEMKRVEDDERMGEFDRKRKNQEPQEPRSEDEDLEYYMRLFSHRRDPLGAALQMLGRNVDDPDLEERRMQQRESGGVPDTTPSTVFTQPNVAPGFRAGSPEEDEDRGVGFDAASIGATTPKTMTANPRVLNDPRSTRAGQGEERTITDFLMTSSDSRSVMDPAWALLKSNPSMVDSEGQSVPPAVMNYANAAIMAEVIDEENKRGRFPSSYVDEGKSHLRPRLDVGERAADVVQQSPYLREQGKNITSSDMKRNYLFEEKQPNIKRMPRREM